VPPSISTPPRPRDRPHQRHRPAEGATILFTIAWIAFLTYAIVVLSRMM
jgi:hypothetical protein